MKKVLVGGCFDLLHYGHITFLKKAKAAGNHLIVMLESDDFIRIRKHRQPVHTQKQRAEILLSLKAVDEVVLLPRLLSDEEYRTMVEKIKPAVIAVTSDDPLMGKKRQQAAMVGAKLKVVTPLIKGFSTNAIIFSD